MSLIRREKNETFLLFRKFAQTIKRPFEVKYNPISKTIDVLESPQDIAKVVNDVRDQLELVTCALNKIKGQKNIMSEF